MYEGKQAVSSASSEADLVRWNFQTRLQACVLETLTMEVYLRNGAVEEGLSKRLVDFVSKDRLTMSQWMIGSQLLSEAHASAVCSLLSAWGRFILVSLPPRTPSPSSKPAFVLDDAQQLRILTFTAAAMESYAQHLIRGSDMVDSASMDEIESFATEQEKYIGLLSILSRILVVLTGRCVAHKTPNHRDLIRVLTLSDIGRCDSFDVVQARRHAAVHQCCSQGDRACAP
jgi:hypothetical protein